MRIPEGVDVLGVRFLRYGQDADYHLSQGVLTVIVPQVIDHEVVAIDVAPSTETASPCSETTASEDEHHRR